jgi:hypothetical protein
MVQGERMGIMTEETFCQRHKLDKPCVLCEKEETLSDKIFTPLDTQGKPLDRRDLDIEDVKEFIQKLKEDFQNMWNYKTTWLDIENLIDKLAGDDLIHSQKSTESKQTPTNAPIQGGAGCKSSGASDNQNYPNPEEMREIAQEIDDINEMDIGSDNKSYKNNGKETK